MYLSIIIPSTPDMNKLILVSLTIGLLLLSGCITIIEKYNIYKDGSGTMEYIIDMSEMYEMMATFSDSIDKMEGLDFINEILPELSRTAGISNVENTSNLARYIAGVKFDFKNVSALNNVLDVLLKGEESSSAKAKYVEINGKNFTRYSLTSKEFNKEALLGSKELDEETMNLVLKSMKYKISVSFEKTIKKVITLAPYTKEGKTVTIDTDFSEIFGNPDILKTTIKTK